MLIPGDLFEVPTRNGKAVRKCLAKAWQDKHGIWHVPYDGGEYQGTELPSPLGYAPFCWTRNERYYE